MRILLCLLISMIVACTDPDAESDPLETPGTPETAQLLAEQPAGSYGDPLGLDESTPIIAILNHPEQFEGSTVRITGTIQAVCPKRGCWIDVADGGEQMRVKVEDGVIVFPLSAAGHTATVEGVVERLSLDRDAALRYEAHLAEERGEPFDSSRVTAPVTLWRIRGKGATIESG